ncbi:MAG: hypothetical protein ISS17_03480 [Bacteroidales bacterium]|nr:hypothetical protein [Bacteroidales bacterium]
MNQLAKKIRTVFSVKIRQIHLDLVLPEAPDVLLQSTADLDCRLLVYVAAYSKVKSFLSSNKEEFEKYIGVNCRMPLQLIHGFAKRLTEQNRSW